MSDNPPRPRIRPATSDDWQKDQSDRAGQNLAQGQESGQSAADYDTSTYYEYLEKHTGDLPASANRSRNVFAPASSSLFPEQPQSAHGPQVPTGPPATANSAPNSAQNPAANPASQAHGGPPYYGQAGSGTNGPGSGPMPHTLAPGPKKSNGAKIATVIIAILMILALLGFLGVRWLAPSTGTVPVDVGGDETTSAPPSPTDTLVQPTASPEEALSSYTKAGTAKAGDLEGQWVTQVSAKDVGLKADGKTWTAQDILNEFEANRVKYPGSILIHSGDWDSYKDGDYWVTVIDTPYSDPEPALDQCRSWGLDRNHCLAKRLVQDGSPKDNSAYLDK